ncbi:MAG: hypothetical protein M1812_006858 [Candelaria pacifica]|nr:MAG: hypothetical protein M1812_006858 [Candelaria pacifica]
MSSGSQYPSNITGGCLCGAIRYTVDFPEGSVWPPTPQSCQCTLCRKWTGTLIPQFLELSPSQIHWETSPPAKYTSSKGVYRAFCKNCGSSLYMEYVEPGKEEFSLTVGTLDEKWLIGEKMGNGIERKGGYGKELGLTTGGTVWFQNRIEGVTDLIRVGKRWEEMSDSKEM